MYITWEKYIGTTIRHFIENDGSRSVIETNYIEICVKDTECVKDIISDDDGICVSFNDGSCESLISKLAFRKDIPTSAELDELGGDICKTPVPVDMNRCIYGATTKYRSVYLYGSEAEKIRWAYDNRELKKTFNIILREANSKFKGCPNDKFTLNEIREWMLAKIIENYGKAPGNLQVEVDENDGNTVNVSMDDEMFLNLE